MLAILNPDSVPSLVPALPSWPPGAPLCFTHPLLVRTSALCICDALWLVRDSGECGYRRSTRHRCCSSPAIQTAPLDGNKVESSGPIVIDNDEAQLQGEYEWKEIPDGPDKTHIVAGARFPVAVQSQLSSKTAKVGDLVEARHEDRSQNRRSYDCAQGLNCNRTHHRRHKGAKVARGRIYSQYRGCACQARLGCNSTKSSMTKTSIFRWWPHREKSAHNQESCGRTRARGQCQRASGKPARPTTARQALHLAIRAAASAGGVFSFGIVPAVFACTGAISPSFAYCRPRRQKRTPPQVEGFQHGTRLRIAGRIPCLGQHHSRRRSSNPSREMSSKPNSKRTSRAKPRREANLLPGAKTKVHGIVLPDQKEIKRVDMIPD